MVNALLDWGAKINTQNNKDRVTALMLAAEKGHHRVVEALAYRGAEINTQDKDGWTALIMAAQNGHYRVVKALLELCGPKINTQNNNGYTALMIAAAAGHDTVVRSLLDRGAEIALN